MFLAILIYQSLQNLFVRSSENILSPCFDDGLYSNIPLHDTLTDTEIEEIAHLYKVMNEYEITALSKKITEVSKPMFDKYVIKFTTEKEQVVLEELYCSIYISRILKKEVSGIESDEIYKYLKDPELISRKAQESADLLKKVIDFYEKYTFNRNSNETCDTSKKQKISPFTLEQAKLHYNDFMKSKAINEKKILMDQFFFLQDKIDKSDRLMNNKCMTHHLNKSVFDEISIERRKVYINYENYTNWLKTSVFEKSCDWDITKLEKIVKDTRKSMQNVFEKYLLDETIKE